MFTHFTDNSPIIDSSKLQSNKKNKIDGLDLLDNIAPKSIKVVFFDPQYRGV